MYVLSLSLSLLSSYSIIIVSSSTGQRYPALKTRNNICCISTFIIGRLSWCFTSAVCYSNDELKVRKKKTACLNSVVTCLSVTCVSLYVSARWSNLVWCAISLCVLLVRYSVRLESHRLLYVLYVYQICIYIYIYTYVYVCIYIYYCYIYIYIYIVCIVCIVLYVRIVSIALYDCVVRVCISVCLNSALKIIACQMVPDRA